MYTHRSDIFSIDSVYDTLHASRGRFFAAFFTVLLVTYGFFYAIDFLPEAPQDNDTSRVASAATHEREQVSVNEGGGAGAVDESEELRLNDSVTDTIAVADSNATPRAEPIPAALPLRIHIDALDRDIPILNPTSRAIADLDAALKDGAVRHPDAADFVREGNIFVLGHSSRLPNVLNRNYQIFNGIENLEWGDTIRVYSEDTEYIYRVDRVYEAKASALTIPIAGTGPRLTLVTCDTLGAIEDRFIVEAELQSSRPL